MAVNVLTARVLRGTCGLDIEQVPGEWRKLRKDKIRVARSFKLNNLKFTDSVNGSQNRGKCKNGDKGKAFPLQTWKALRFLGG